MALPSKNPLPPPSVPWAGAPPSLPFAQYMAKLDALIAAMAAGNISDLVNAANDAAAAAAGVAIGQIYRNGNALQVRLT